MENFDPEGKSMIEDLLLIGLLVMTFTFGFFIGRLKHDKLTKRFTF